MKSIRKSLVIRGMICIHFCAMVALFAFGQHLFYGHLRPQNGYNTTPAIAICVVYGGIYLLLSRVYNAYKFGLFRVTELLYAQTLANVISLGMTYCLMCLLAFRICNPLGMLAVAAGQFLFSTLWSWYENRLYFSLHKAKRSIVIYRSEQDLKKLQEIYFFENRWKIEDYVLWNESKVHDVPRGNITEIASSVKDIQLLIDRMRDYDVVFISGINATLRNGIVKYCMETGKDCYFVPHTGDVITSGAQHIQSFSVPICRARRRKLTPELMFFKRSFDVLASLAAIIVFSPFMIGAAIAIKVYDRGPALYRQVRLTKDGKRFEILKFRSMRVDAEKDGVARLASEHDDRITPVGKFIRAVRFDELPQLFNILKGDMSIVGPRPERPEIAEQYMQELPAFDLRLQVKAGLTGYAQVYGRYNTEPADKLKMDLMYINRISMVEDLKIIFSTIRILFMRESTSGVAEGQTTAVKDVQKSA